MNPTTTDRFGLAGKIDQSGYVVTDLETSLPQYEALYGDFKVAEIPLDGVMCRGELSEVRPVADWSEQEIIRTAVGQAEPKEVAA